MNVRLSRRVTTALTVVATTAALTAGVLAGTVGPASASASAVSASTVAPSDWVHYLGHIENAGSHPFSVTVPLSGKYVVRYNIEGVAALSTEVDGTDLAQISGTAGLIDTQSFTLTAGTHVVDSSEPEGWLGATVYLALIG